MNTLVEGEQPFLTAWLEQRRALGQDHRDEVWGGVHQVVPHASVGHARVAAQVLVTLSPRCRERRLVEVSEFDLGEPGDFRVPDGGWLAPDAEDDVCAPTAVAVLEVLSPGDETYAKFDFYAVRDVQEVLVADPEARSVTCFARADGEWRPAADSAVFGCSTTWLAAQVRWP